MSLISEFKEFAMKGSVVDLAVGVIIGAAFGAVVTSLVENIMMPPLGYLIGRVDFSELAIRIPTNADPVEIRYGAFINAVIKFVIQAMAIFLVVKAMNRLNRQKEQAADLPAQPVEPQLSTQEKLLTEIRDLMAREPG